MEKEKKRILTAVILLSIIPIGLLGLYNFIVYQFPVEVSYSGPESIEGLSGDWYVSGPYGYQDNVYYAVTFRSVVFRFLSARPNPGLLDAGTPISISVTYSDSTIEYFEFAVGGLVVGAPFFHMGNHTNPTVVIITHSTSNHTDWYSWYYGVSENN